MINIKDYTEYIKELVTPKWRQDNKDFFTAKIDDEIEKIDDETEKIKDEYTKILKSLKYTDIKFSYKKSDYVLKEPEILKGKVLAYEDRVIIEERMGKIINIRQYYNPYNYKVYLGFINSIDDDKFTFIFTKKSIFKDIISNLPHKYYITLCEGKVANSYYYLGSFFKNKNDYIKTIKYIKSDNSNYKIIYINNKVSNKDYVDYNAINKEKAIKKIKKLPYTEITFDKKVQGDTIKYYPKFKDDELNKFGLLDKAIYSHIPEQRKVYFGHIRGRYHFGYIDSEARGTGLGYKLYKAFARHKGFLITDEQSSKSARKIYDHLLNDSDLYHIIDRSGKDVGNSFGSDSSKILLIHKDYPKLKRLVELIRLFEKKSKRTYEYDQRLNNIK